MDTLIDLSWRAYPGGALLAAGIVLLVHGGATVARSFCISMYEGRRSVAFVTGLRQAIIGMAVAGLAGAWIWHQLWLLALSLAIGGEELLETSFVLWVLRRAQRRDARQSEASA